MLSVSVDIQGLIRKIDIAVKQLPFATALALTRTGQAVKAAEVAEMKSVFSAPTAYTLNSLTVAKATKSQLTATVGVKNEDEGIGAVRWLRPEVYGGPRAHAIEALLRPLGLPPNGMFAVPGPAAKMRGKAVDIGWLRSLIEDIADQGVSTARGVITRGSKGTRKRKGQSAGVLQYFVLVAPWGKLHPGIYGRRGRSIYPLIFFVRQPRYGAKFDFYRVAQRVAQQTFPAEFKKAVDVAMGTAR